MCCQILLRLSKLCVQEGSSGKKSRKQQQRLLRNMGAHSVVLELLQIPYEKVQVVFDINMFPWHIFQKVINTLTVPHFLCFRVKM